MLSKLQEQYKKHFPGQSTILQGRKNVQQKILNQTLIKMMTFCSNRRRSKTPSTPTLTSSTSPSPPTFQSIGQKTGPHWERSLQGSSTTTQTNSISPKMSAQSEQGSDWTTGIVVWDMHLSDFFNTKLNDIHNFPI